MSSRVYHSQDYHGPICPVVGYWTQVWPLSLSLSVVHVMRIRQRRSKECDDEKFQYSRRHTELSAIIKCNIICQNKKNTSDEQSIAPQLGACRRHYVYLVPRLRNFTLVNRFRVTWPRIHHQSTDREGLGKAVQELGKLGRMCDMKFVVTLFNARGGSRGGGVGGNPAPHLILGKKGRNYIRKKSPQGKQGDTIPRP